MICQPWLQPASETRKKAGWPVSHSGGEEEKPWMILQVSNVYLHMNFILYIPAFILLQCKHWPWRKIHFSMLNIDSKGFLLSDVIAFRFLMKCTCWDAVCTAQKERFHLHGRSSTLIGYLGWHWFICIYISENPPWIWHLNTNARRVLARKCPCRIGM